MKLQELFPWPFVGAVVLLLVLILLTPNLVSTASPSAGSLQTQAELIIDQPNGANASTHVYLRGLGLVRYQSLEISLATNVTWPVHSASNLSWVRNITANQSLDLSSFTKADPFGISVKAVYVDQAGATAAYGGVFVFRLQGGTLFTQPLDPSPGPLTASTDFPFPILLNTLPPRGG
jgi:hypothetical protein